MNQEQIKNLLLSVEEAPLDFSVVLSGKKSRKVNGLYKPDTREIILHNKNFTNDNLLMYTALHEYAHHLRSCKHDGPQPSRTHTQEFWATFHHLLEKAEAKKVYTNVYTESSELATLTETIREKYIKQNGTLFKELGSSLIAARDLCEKQGLRFEDYIDRVLCIPRLAARIAIKSYSYDLDPAIGVENMRFVSAISDEAERGAAEKALLSGQSPDSVKISRRTARNGDEPRIKLEHEKTRLERTIETLAKRLKEVENELESL